MIFLTVQARALVFFDISRYLTGKYFDVVWECQPRGPPNRLPNINFLNGSTYGCFDIRRYLRDKYFYIVWGSQPPPPPPPGDSSKWTTPKINFLNGSTYGPSVL